jgi:HPt (histidine-containing phosphotransfer) domain-containing protein
MVSILAKNKLIIDVMKKIDGLDKYTRKLTNDILDKLDKLPKGKPWKEIEEEIVDALNRLSEIKDEHESYISSLLKRAVHRIMKGDLSSLGLDHITESVLNFLRNNPESLCFKIVGRVCERAIGECDEKCSEKIFDEDGKPIERRIFDENEKLIEKLEKEISLVRKNINLYRSQENQTVSAASNE